MKSFQVFLTLIALVSAAPLVDWSPAMAEFYSAVDAHIQKARESRNLTPPSCDLSKASLPASSLPPPTGTLSEVVIGRGVQNYTCASSDASTVPVAIGAVADLYNVNCIAANFPDILAMLPLLALQYPPPSSSSSEPRILAPSNLVLSGHHYFNASNIPTFDVTKDQLGISFATKNASCAAPATAPTNSVAWLLLHAVAGTTGDVKNIYRIDTAGGGPPSNCSGQASVFSVQYAAQYWFYTA